LGGFFSDSMAVMVSKLFDRLWDKLPTWAKFIFAILTILGSMYYIAQDGFWTFLLHVIFSP
jgi:hypothetical protein